MITETLPWEPDTFSPKIEIPPTVTQAEKADSWNEVKRTYERDMEAWENDRMKRDDKALWILFAPKFKRAKVDDFSLDDFMTGGDFPVSDSQPSPLEQRCKVWKSGSG